MGVFQVGTMTFSTATSGLLHSALGSLDPELGLASQSGASTLSRGKKLWCREPCCARRPSCRIPLLLLGNLFHPGLRPCSLFRSVQPVGHEHHVAHPITRTSHGSVASPAVRAGCRPQTTGGSEASLVLTSPSSVLALANSGNNAHTCNTERPTLVCAAACSEADYVGDLWYYSVPRAPCFPAKVPSKLVAILTETLPGDLAKLHSRPTKPLFFSLPKTCLLCSSAVHAAKRARSIIGNASHGYLGRGPWAVGRQLSSIVHPSWRGALGSET